MKKFLGVILLLVSPVLWALPGFNNLINGGDFETYASSAYWVQYSTNATFSVKVSTPGQTLHVYSGSGVGYLVIYSTASDYIYQVVPVTAGHYYAGGAYLFDGDEAGYARIKVFWYASSDGGHSAGDEPIAVSESPKSHDDWTNWQFNYLSPVKAPAGAKSARFAIYFEVTGYADLYIDEVSFYELGGGGDFRDVAKAVNFPNPFSPTRDGRTTIVLPKSLEGNELELRIYNLGGELIRKIEGSSSWDGKDEDGHIVSRGIYFYSVKTERGRATGKITVVR